MLTGTPAPSAAATPRPAAAAAGPAFGAPTPSSSPAPAARPSSAPPPPPTAAPLPFTAQLQHAMDTHTLPTALAAEIKGRLAIPYAVQTGGVGGGATGPQPQPQQGQAWGPPSVPAVAVGLGLPGVGAEASAAAARSGSTITAPLTVAAQQAENLSQLLSVLLACDSGFMNTYENEVRRERNEDGKEVIPGLHAAVGSIANSTAVHILEHLSKELSATALGYDGVRAALQGTSRGHSSTATRVGAALVGVHAQAGRTVSHVGSNPLMAGAQCLYLLSRHFQMQPSFVKEALVLVDTLLGHVQTELSGRRIRSVREFRDGPDTAALCTLTWLVVMSVANALAVWKKVRATTGTAALSQNSLLRSDVATTVGTSVAAMRRRFEDVVLTSSAAASGRREDSLGFLTSGSRGGAGVAGGVLGGLAAGAAGVTGGGGGGGRAPGSASAAAALLRSGATNVAAAHRWLAVVEGFLSILTAAEGCFLCAKGESDKGYERALEAFAGDRGSPLSVIFGGRFAKRLVQLAPSPSTLAIPVDLIYIAPYEILSHMFDDMLPLVRHIAVLELDSTRAYLDELQRREEESLAAALALEGGRGPRGYPASSAYRDSGAARLSWDDIFGGASAGSPGSAGGGAGAGAPDAEDASSASFMTEMASILSCVAVCLEHLSPDVLDPDLDADCSVTFFVFRNCVKHMAQVFALQRSGSTLWENFTLVLVSRFLDVLAMIGRNPQYVERVVRMLTETQAECAELQWGSLIRQALECAGFISGRAGRGGDGGSAGPTRGEEASGFLAGADPSHVGPRQSTQPQQQPLLLPYPLTVEFARRCQQRYISSFFMFLRQVFAHPVLRETVMEHMSLELALSFMFAPWQSQSMLGSTLSLISALVATPAEAALVWSFLETNKLLQPPTFAAWAGGTGAGGGRAGPHGGGDGSTSNTAGDAGVAPRTTSPYRDENLSLLGHCLFEETIGVYDITVGFLNLMIALFRHSAPGPASFPSFASVALFIAEDIFIGVSKRSFGESRERYHVIALAAAALRQALAVRFVEDGAGAVGAGAGAGASLAGTDATSGGLAIPFATVMAPSKSPTDVTGEALAIILRASSAPYELASHERAATRQCVQLLSAAIRTVAEERLEVFSFDSRTTQNASLAYHALYLCSLNDPLLMRAALELLLHFPRPVMAQATSYWYGEAGQLLGVVALFADLLHPFSVAAHGSIVRAPPELAALDTDPADAPLSGGGGGGSCAGPAAASATVDLARASRSLLLDLLIAHAPHAELSMTVWLCGLMSAASPAAAPGSVVVAGGPMNQLTDTQILDSVVAGATSPVTDATDPGLAVKYVKLLYLLRANRLYGPTLIRGFVEAACHDLFLPLQRFKADECSPVLLSKYAYVLRLLALEAADVYAADPAQLDVSHAVVPSIPAEVLLSLLSPSRAGQGEAAGGAGEAGDDAVGALPRGLSVDVAQWLPECFRRLARFPASTPPSGRDAYLVPAAKDGTVQFNITALYAAMQAEQQARQLPPLTTGDLRARLTPFIEANQCFLEYASVVNFVAAWCQLVDIACSVVRGLTSDRMRAFFATILSTMDATTRMTLAAQEQVGYQLFRTLTTVTAQLKRRCVEEELTRASLRVRDGHTSLVAGAPAAQRRRRHETVSGSTPSDSGVYGAGGGGSTRNRSIFATAAGEESNLLSIAGRTRLARHALDEGGRSRTGGWVGPSDSLPAGNNFGNLPDEPRAVGVWMASTLEEDGETAGSAAAANQTLLRRLVVAVAQWGPRMPAIRADAYVSLLCLTQIPGVSAEDYVVFRCQDRLLDLLAADVSGSGAHGVAPPSTAAYALSLLLRLLQTSPALSDVFCGAAAEDGAAGAGGRQLQCARALLRDVDDAVSGFLAGGGGSAAAGPGGVRSFGSVLWLVRATFDLLSHLALRGAAQLLQGHVVARCMLMECWNRAAQVVAAGGSVGATPSAAVVVGAAGGGGPTHTPVVNQAGEVVRRLLLGTVRWLNTMQAAMADPVPLTGPLQEFVRMRRHMLETVLDCARPTAGPVAAGDGGGWRGVGRGAAGAVSGGTRAVPPLAGVGAAMGMSAAAGGPPAISAPALTLLAEVTGLLHNLSASTLAAECRVLVGELALPELLLSISSPAFEHLCRECVHGDYMEDKLPATAGVVATAAGAHAAVGGMGSPPVARPVDLAALARRNLAHVLLRCEYGLRATATEPDLADVAAPYPRLRGQPGQVRNVIQIAEQLAHVLAADAAGAGTGGGAPAVVASAHRLECHLLAVHAVVCLLHSFVLPLPAGPAEDHVKHFAPYLRGLPLQAMYEALTSCQRAVYEQRDLNADYRAGVAGLRWVAGPNTWVGGAGSSKSNAMATALLAAEGATSGTTSRSALGGSGAGETGSAGTPSLRPRGGRGPRSAPDTPLFTAEAGNALMGTRERMVRGASPPSAAGAGAVGGGTAGPCPTSTLALSAVGGRQTVVCTNDVPQLGVGGAGLAGARLGGVTEAGATIGDLIATGRGEAGADGWNALLASEPSLPSWESVLSMENAVRQVKIAIANAMRATASAMDLASRS